MIETTLRDLGYAVRTLRRSPSFTATSIAVLALAIGANTAMFSVLNAVLLRPLPYPAPEQLAMLWSEVPSQNVREGRTAYWNVEQWRAQNRSFAAMAFFDGVTLTITSSEGAEKISGARISQNLFAVLGIQPVHGRVFSEEEAAAQQRLAVISHHFWQARFGGSFDAIGSSIDVDGRTSRIIGILPAGFAFGGSDVDVWEPCTAYPDWENIRRAKGAGFWSVIGRLRPGVSVEQAQAEMNTIARRMDEQMPPAGRNRGISVVPLSLEVTGHRARLALWMLSGAVFFVLLIAATNVASLSLARSASREREMAIRVALGAGRARIVRQLLAESLTLAMVAGALGLLVAHACIRLILAIRPGELYRLDEVALNPVVLGCAAGLCLLTGVLVGLAPAVTMSRRSVSPSAHEGGRGIAGGMATRRLRRALVTAEFALAIILLTGSGLLVRSLWSVSNVDSGFRADRVLMVALAPPASLPVAQRASFYSRVLEQVRSLPGVESASVTSEVFIGGNPERVITAQGAGGPVSESLRFRSDEISEEFFQTLSTPLLKGRFFLPGDGRNSTPVAIINEAMAKQLWPGRDATGMRFKVGAVETAGVWYTVAGVVGDMRRQGPERAPLPQMFEPLAQNPPRRAILLVKTATSDPLKVAGTVQASVRQVEKHALVYGVNTLENRLGAFLTERRFQTSLLISFSVIALLMAAIGIYGLIQYSIETRRHEIGIRIAIGAQAGQIFRMVLSEGLKLSLVGLLLGLVGALGLGRAGSSLLFGVSATDPMTLIAVSLLLTGVATAACFFPARRAMNVEPVTALRQE